MLHRFQRPFDRHNPVSMAAAWNLTAQSNGNLPDCMSCRVFVLFILIRVERERETNAGSNNEQKKKKKKSDRTELNRLE